jgi:hypothetical protein
MVHILHIHASFTLLPPICYSGIRYEVVEIVDQIVSNPRKGNGSASPVFKPESVNFRYTKLSVSI